MDTPIFKILNRINYFVCLGLFGSPSSRFNDGRSLFNYTDAALFSFYSPGWRRVQWNPGFYYVVSKLKQGRFWALHVNRKWTVSIHKQLFCPNFRPNCLYETIDPKQYKFGSVIANKKRRGLTSFVVRCSKTLLLKLLITSSMLCATTPPPPPPPPVKNEKETGSCWTSIGQIVRPVPSYSPRSLCEILLRPSFLLVSKVANECLHMCSHLHTFTFFSNPDYVFFCFCFFAFWK